MHIDFGFRGEVAIKPWKAPGAAEELQHALQRRAPGHEDGVLAMASQSSWQVHKRLQILEDIWRPLGQRSALCTCKISTEDMKGVSRHNSFGLIPRCTTFKHKKTFPDQTQGFYCF